MTNDQTTGSFTDQVENELDKLELPAEVSDDVAETVRAGGAIRSLNVSQMTTNEVIQEIAVRLNLDADKVNNALASLPRYEATTDTSIAIPHITREAALAIDPTAMDAVKETDPNNVGNWQTATPEQNENFIQSLDAEQPNPFAGLSDDEIAQVLGEDDEAIHSSVDDYETPDTLTAAARDEIENVKQWADTETKEDIIIHTDGSTATVVQEMLHIFSQWLLTGDNAMMVQVLAEQKAALNHSDTVIANLEKMLEHYEQTEIRDALAAELWKNTTDFFNEVLVGQPEAETNAPLLDRIQAYVQRVSGYDGDLSPMLAELLTDQPEAAQQVNDSQKLYMMIKRLERSSKVADSIREKAAMYDGLNR